MKDKVILVTGGSGSLGMALLPLLLEQNPYSVRILSNNEYEMYLAMEKIKDTRIRPLIGDIRDKDRMMRAMNGVDYVIHAAAMKHINFCEYNPIDAVKTNILGSINVIDCAIDNNVERVLAISSDKAVYPTNLYGASKLVMEKLFIQSANYGKTKFSCVRFGNFPKSKGNFFETIDKKIFTGKPITITSKDMERYWISLEDASKFVMKCLQIMEGREIFVPKMEKEKIMAFIPLDYPIEIIGKRDGEKISESLFADEESARDCGDFFTVKSE